MNDQQIHDAAEGMKSKGIVVSVTGVLPEVIDLSVVPTMSTQPTFKSLTAEEARLMAMHLISAAESVERTRRFTDSAFAQIRREREISL